MGRGQDGPGIKSEARAEAESAGQGGLARAPTRRDGRRPTPYLVVGGERSPSARIKSIEAQDLFKTGE